MNCSNDNRILMKKITRKLIKWWTNNDHKESLFPWRSHLISPYQALITEVLLQRTRAEAVNRLFGDFFRKFPDPEALCMASEQTIKITMYSLGLSWRAKKLKELGCAIINGIPDKMEDLLKLPGVGPYAAGAYLSLHCNKRAIIPDVNMTRILGRIFGFKVQPEIRRNRSFFELCEQITPKKDQRVQLFNYDFGRMICRPKNSVAIYAF